MPKKDWDRRLYRWAHTILPYGVIYFLLFKGVNELLQVWGIIPSVLIFSALAMRILSVGDLKEMGQEAERILGKRKPEQETLPLK